MQPAPATTRGQPGQTWWIACAVLAAAVLVAHAPVALGWESYYHHDRYHLHVPFWHAARETIAAGGFPFWHPGIRCGYPLHANGEASLLYPLTWLFAPFFAAHRALDLFTLFHLVLGGGFCWLFLRRLTGDARLALIGAAAWVLSGRMNGLTIWGHAVAAAAWLPLLLWAIDRRAVAGIALAVGMGALTGRPQVHVLTLLVGAAYAAFRLAAAWRGARALPRADAARLAAGFAIGLCLGAPQVLPTVELVGVSTRMGGTGFEEWSSYALGGIHLRQMLVPWSGVRWPEAPSYPTLFVYAGVLLALAGPRRRAGRGDAAFWLVLAGASLYVAFGGPGAYTVSQELPLLRSFRVPARFAHIAAFGCLVAAVLAWRHVVKERPRLAWALLAVVVADGSTAVLAGRHTVFASAYDQLPHGHDLLRTAPRDGTGSARRFFSAHQWHDPHLLAGRPRAQVDALFASLPPVRNRAMQFGFRDMVGDGEPGFGWFLPETTSRGYEALAICGVEYLFFASQTAHPELVPVDAGVGPWHTYRVRSPVPRAVVVDRIGVSPNALEAWRAATAPGFDPRRTAVVEAGALEPREGSGSMEPGSVHVREEGTNRVRLRVTSPGPGAVVLFDTWAPGWTATVDGASRRVHRADGCFRLVEVPAGRCEVVMSYAAPGFAAGLWLALCGVVALLGVAWRGRRRG